VIGVDQFGFVGTAAALPKAPDCRRPNIPVDQNPAEVEHHDAAGVDAGAGVAFSAPGNPQKCFEAGH
jgi:hypothetical protein